MKIDYPTIVNHLAGKTFDYTSLGGASGKASIDLDLIIEYDDGTKAPLRLLSLTKTGVTYEFGTGPDAISVGHITLRSDGFEAKFTHVDGAQRSEIWKYNGATKKS